MAKACNITTRSGQSKGYENAVQGTIKGELQGEGGPVLEVIGHLPHTMKRLFCYPFFEKNSSKQCFE